MLLLLLSEFFASLVPVACLFTLPVPAEILFDGVFVCLVVEDLALAGAGFVAEDDSAIVFLALPLLLLILSVWFCLAAVDSRLPLPLLPVPLRFVPDLFRFDDEVSAYSHPKTTLSSQPVSDLEELVCCREDMVANSVRCLVIPIPVSGSQLIATDAPRKLHSEAWVRSR